MADLQLDTLEAKGLIRLAQFQPELEYLFRHALVQDTAYESLLKQERRQLHRLVGDAIEELYPDRKGDLAAVLAMHFEQAGDSTRALRYLMSAAAFAYERNAIVEAYELYSRAEALLPPPADDDDDEMIQRRVGVQLGRVRAGFAFLHENEGITILERAAPDAERQNDLRLTADVYLTLAILRQFRGARPESDSELQHNLDRVSEIAAELEDPLIAALPNSLIGLFQVFTGHLREGVEALESAVPQLTEKRDFVGSSFGLVALAIGYARLGEFDKAAEAARRASEVAEGGDLIARLDALIGEAMVKLTRGDVEAAIPLASQCTTLAEEHGATACIVGSNFVLGSAYMDTGDFNAAENAFRRGNEVADAVEQKIWRPSIVAFMRANAANMGEFSPSGRSFDEALNETREIGDAWGEATVLWMRAGTELKKQPGARDEETMLADFAASAGLFHEMGGRPFEARVLHDWGRALRGLGRIEEGDEKLRTALKLFEEMGMSRVANGVNLELAAKPMSLAG